jgi:glycosyltransferase involved in cell wall biosynthesis
LTTGTGAAPAAAAAKQPGPQPALQPAALPALKGRILIEGHNLTLATGTGIATYARQLGEAVAGIGYAPEVLVGSARGLDPKDPELAEVSLFDAERKPSLGQSIGIEWRRATTSPFSVRPVEMTRSGTVISQATSRLAGFGKIHAVPHLLEQERNYFKRYGRPLPLTLKNPPQLFHATRPAPLRVKGCPNIYTLHDIVPLRLPHTTADDKKFYLNMIRDLCRTADHIITVSEFSRQDIIQLTGLPERRITNTYQAVQLPPRLLARDESVVARELEALFGLGMQDYFLFVGAIEPKKNLSRLIDAYAASGANRPLIIAGGLGWMFDGDVKKMESERFLSYRVGSDAGGGQTIKPQRSIRHLSYLPFDHLISLMRGARALLFPSLYEGFGLPVLEAMTLGTPVMTSTISSLPEIAGDAAVLCDPYDIDAMGQAIRRLDADGDLRAELAARGRAQAEKFSPARYAARLTEVYGKLL